MMTAKIKVRVATALKRLQAERQRIEAEIAQYEGAMQELVHSARADVGRQDPPAESRAGTMPRLARQRSRAGWTDAARQGAAERMRRYWQREKEARAAGCGSKRQGRRLSKASHDARPRSRKGWTDEAREAARQRMIDYWAARAGQRLHS